MKNQKKQIKALVITCGILFGAAAAQAQTLDRPIKIGVLSDMSSLYADQAGLGSVEAAKMAIEDAGGKIGNQPIELVSADHQHKTDVATSIVRHWFDVDGVDVVVDMPNSAVALAVQQIAKEKNKIALYATAATTELTGKQCSPNGIQWVYDAYSNAAGLAKALVAKGDKSWYLHHGRLCARHLASGRGREGRHGAGRHGGRQRPPSVEQSGLQFVPAAGAGLEREGDRASPMRAPTRSTRSSRRRSSV